MSRAQDTAPMAQKTEFELKLVGTPAEIAQAPGLSFLDKIAAGKGAWERLVSTYYDSVDRRLAAAGLSLRVREDAGAATLTAKLTPRGRSALCRFESERAIDPSSFQFRTGEAEIDRIIGADPRDLAPIARTVTDRWSRLIECGGALIEMAVDLGTAEAMGHRAHSTPLAEIELELMKGGGAALFDLAARLMAAFDGRLRVSVAPKLARALGEGAPHRRPALAEGATAADALSAALEETAVRIVEAAAMVVDFRDGDAARRLRAALRRLRAIKRIFRPHMKKSGLRALTKEARRLARVVGRARDLDVFAATSLPLAPHAAVRSHFEARRADAWTKAALALADPAFAAFSLKLFRVAYLAPRSAPRLSRPGRPLADEALDRRWARLMRRAASADFATPRTLHPLRLELKRTRAAAQIFRDFYPADARKPFFGTIGALQAEFGQVSDAVVAVRLALKASERLDPSAARALGVIAGYRAAEATALSAALEERWRAFAAAPPYWRAADDPPTDGS